MPKQIGRKKLNVTNKPLHNINLVQDAYQPPKVGRVKVFPTIDHEELKEQRAETATIKAANRRAKTHPRKMTTNMGGLNRVYGDAAAIYKHESQQYAITELFKKFGTNFAGTFTTDNQKAAFTDQAPENADPNFFFQETPAADEPNDIPFDFPFNDDHESSMDATFATAEEEASYLKNEMRRDQQKKVREAYIQSIEAQYATKFTGARGRPKHTKAQKAQSARQRNEKKGMGANDYDAPDVVSSAQTDKESKSFV